MFATLVKGVTPAARAVWVALTGTCGQAGNRAGFVPAVFAEVGWHGFIRVRGQVGMAAGKCRTFLPMFAGQPLS